MSVAVPGLRVNPVGTVEDLRTYEILCSREVGMPIFEYVCKECDHPFEALVFGDEKASCPKCKSKKLVPQLSVFAVSAKAASGTSVPSGACGSCGDPRGPGSCSMRDLD